MSAMIEVRNLQKTFGARAALAGVDLCVNQGELLVVVGPNGAGKTTLQRILATLSRPTGGSVSLAGYDPVADGAEVRRRIGFVSHQSLLYDDLSGRENLLFYGRMYGVANLDRRADSLLGRVGLAERQRDLVRTYSRGMRQRLAIARALLHDPPVLLLDEPYAGLDPEAVEMLDAVMKEAADALDGGRRTILMTTHDLADGLRHSDRLALLVAGKILCEARGEGGGLDHLRALYEGHVDRRGRG